MTEHPVVPEGMDGTQATQGQPKAAEGESVKTVSAKGMTTESKARLAKNRSDSAYVTPPSTSRARVSLEESAPGPVERLRKVSSVVIDQAAYDPSLRFLLVAGALFLLFLLLLIISKVIG